MSLAKSLALGIGIVAIVFIAIGKLPIMIGAFVVALAVVPLLQ